MTAAATTLGDLDLQPAPQVAPAEEGFCLAALAGRLVELSAHGASASLTVALGLVLEAQRLGEPAAWVSCAAGIFHPPDAHEGGVDLAALPVVRAATLPEGTRAVDHLARSGAFGLIVFDLGDHPELPLAILTRMAGQATRHHTAILCLTRKKEGLPSLGSLVSLRAEARRVRLGPDQLRVSVRVLKDKRRGPGWGAEEVCCGPDGLR